MAEYYKKEDVISALLSVPSGNWSSKRYVGEIEQLQPADVVEVVRCQYCVYPHGIWTGCPTLGGIIPDEDFFCAYGKRRETDG